MFRFKMHNYHMGFQRIHDGGGQRWRCTYCGLEDLLDNLRASECLHECDPCPSCGGANNSNECKPDCSEMADHLGSPMIYVAGL